MQTPSTTYEAAKARAAQVVAEAETANGKRIALLRMVSNGSRFLIVTDRGGSERCGKSEEWARVSFDRWVSVNAAAA